MKSTSLNHFKAFQPSPGYGNLLSIQAVALFPQRRYARYALCVVAVVLQWAGRPGSQWIMTNEPVFFGYGEV